MIRVVRQGARWGAVLLALGLLVGPAAAVAAADDEAQEEEAEREVAQIKIEIKLESGRVVKPDDNFTVDFGVENSLAIEADGSRHQFMLKVERKADASDEGEGKKGKEKIEKFCGTATAGIITVHERDKKLAGEAQKRFSSVKSLAKSKVDIPPDDVRRIEDFRNAVAMAQVYQADVDYEEYLTVEMPGDLNFHVDEYKKDSGLPKWEKEYKEQVKKRDDSVKRFQTFMDKKLGLGQKLITAYDGVVAQKQSPYWMLAAAARSAMVSQNFADQLYRAEVPKNFKTEEEYFAYCDALSDKAVPIEQAALEKFTYCLDRSTTFQFFNEFSRLCEAELQQRDPDKYPSTEELFGTSEYTAARPDRVDVQLDLEGEKRKVSLSDDKKKDKEAADGEGEEKDESGSESESESDEG